ncbi:hypothetical protein pb186bvf_005014 [Paramecium bursaria]
MAEQYFYDPQQSKIQNSIKICLQYSQGGSINFKFSSQPDLNEDQILISNNNSFFKYLLDQTQQSLQSLHLLIDRGWTNCWITSKIFSFQLLKEKSSRVFFHLENLYIMIGRMIISSYHLYDFKKQTITELENAQSIQCINNYQENRGFQYVSSELSL